MHFTYQRPIGELQQGDILKPTDALNTILFKYHRHYADRNRYPLLMVLTQSCDLVRRNDICKSRYIILAAIRPFELLIDRELEKCQYSHIETNYRLCLTKQRTRLREFLERLINNNEQGYFYLAEEPELNINDQYVAFLNLSVAIKSNDYDHCLSSRIAQLNEIFQAKLGWLVGYMYSRVGTPDWTSSNTMTQEQFSEYVDSILETDVGWVNDRIIRILREQEKQLRNQTGNPEALLSDDEVESTIAEYSAEVIKKREKIIDYLIEELAKNVEVKDTKQVDSLKRRLLNNPEFDKLIA